MVCTDARRVRTAPGASAHRRSWRAACRSIPAGTDVIFGFGDFDEGFFTLGISLDFPSHNIETAIFRGCYPEKLDSGRQIYAIGGRKLVKKDISVSVPEFGSLDD